MKMLIIDEQGRLFGKLNILDFLVILFLVCSIVIFFFGYKIFFKKTITVEQAKIFSKVEIDGEFIEVKPEILKLITVGDEEIGERGEVIGKIIWIGESRPHQYRFNIGDNKSITKEDPNLEELPVKLRVKTEIIDKGLFYKFKQILLNSPIDFKTSKYNVKAVPFRISGNDESMEVKNLDLYIILKDLTPDMLKLISVGDKELDEKGEVIAEILTIAKIENDIREIDLDLGNFILGEDSNKKQMTVKMRLKCKVNKEGQLYFKEERIIHNTLVAFKTNKCTVKGIVVKTYADIYPFRISGNDESMEVKNLDLYIILKDLTPDMLKLISVGDKELDEKGEVIAEILTIAKIENDIREIDLDLGNFISAEEPNKKQMTVKMRLKCKINKKGQLYFKEERIIHNTLVAFKTNKCTVKGIVAKTYADIYPSLKEKWIKIQVKFSAVIPEVAKIISLGDTEKDLLGKPIGRLSSILMNDKSSDLLLALKEDRLVTFSRPFHRDIVVILDILSIEKEGIFYFKNYPVKMGNMINFTTELYSVNGVIVGIDIK